MSLGSYTSLKYTDRLTEAGALASIGTVGDSYDNAMAESTIGLYKTEMVWPEGPLRNVEHLEYATADHVWWFNNCRIHSAINYDTPIEHEQKYYTQQEPGEQIAPGQKPSTKPVRFTPPFPLNKSSALRNICDRPSVRLHPDRLNVPGSG